MIEIEVSRDELNQEFDQVFADIRKVARVPGFRPGHAPRDLLETYYGKKAEEEVVKRAIPEYYLKGIKEENLAPVAFPEIENVQFKNHTLSFSARVDVRPQIKLKGNYKKLRIIKKKIKIEPSQIDSTLGRLQESKAKEKIKPELNDTFAKDLGFATLQELREAINKNLQANAEAEVKADLEKQILDQILKNASLDVPESLVASETQELLKQAKLNRILQGEKKEDIQSKEKELESEAKIEAIRRVKLSFTLEKIAQLENIQVDEKDLDARLTEISQAHPGKSKDELRQHLESRNLIPGLKAELRDRKTIGFLLNEAQTYGTK